MLFTIKNRLIPTLLLCGAFVLLSLWIRQTLNLSWNLDFYPGFLHDAALGLTIIVIINLCLHGIFRMILETAYLKCCIAFVNLFRSQGALHFLAGGLLAAAEEMIFRGLLLEGFLHKVGMGNAWAITLSALVFGICHYIPGRQFLTFTFWAVFEGVLLGVFYVLTGSLLVLMIAHFVNDACGFATIAWVRKTGLLLDGKL